MEPGTIAAELDDLSRAHLAQWLDATLPPGPCLVWAGGMTCAAVLAADERRAVLLVEPRPADLETAARRPRPGVALGGPDALATHERFASAVIVDRAPIDPRVPPEPAAPSHGAVASPGPTALSAADHRSTDRPGSTGPPSPGESPASAPGEPVTDRPPANGQGRAAGGALADPRQSADPAATGALPDPGGSAHPAAAADGHVRVVDAADVAVGVLGVLDAPALDQAVVVVIATPARAEVIRARLEQRGEGPGALLRVLHQDVRLASTIEPAELDGPAGPTTPVTTPAATPVTTLLITGPNSPGSSGTAGTRSDSSETVRVGSTHRAGQGALGRHDDLAAGPPAVRLGPDAGPARWWADQEALRATLRSLDEELRSEGAERIRALTDDLEAAERRVAELTAHTDGLQRRIDDLEASTSWRVSAPLRWVADRARRR